MIKFGLKNRSSNFPAITISSNRNESTRNYISTIHCPNSNSTTSIAPVVASRLVMVEISSVWKSIEKPTAPRSKACSRMSMSDTRASNTTRVSSCLTLALASRWISSDFANNWWLVMIYFHEDEYSSVKRAKLPLWLTPRLGIVCH